MNWCKSLAKKNRSNENQENQNCFDLIYDWCYINLFVIWSLTKGTSKNSKFTQPKMVATVLHN